MQHMEFLYYQNVRTQIQNQTRLLIMLEYMGYIQAYKYTFQ